MQAQWGAGRALNGAHLRGVVDDDGLSQITSDLGQVLEKYEGQHLAEEDKEAESGVYTLT